MNVRRFPLARILVVFLAGVIFMISTACSQTPSASTLPSRVADDTADTAGTGDSSSTKPYSAKPTSQPGGSTKATYPLEDIQAEHMKESYSPTERVPGSMNNFKDTEQGVDRAESKADYLVQQAKKNLEKRAGNPKEAVDNLKANDSRVGDNLNDFTDSVGRSAQDVKAGAAKGFKNLQENAKSAADDATQNIR